MPAREVEGLPLFPQSPPGILRMEHAPTVEASIQYWEAVRIRATRSHDHRLERTAMGLRLSYEAARLKLTKVKNPPTARRRSDQGKDKPG